MVKEKEADLKTAHKRFVNRLSTHDACVVLNDIKN